jgi:hypothetical protein
MVDTIEIPNWAYGSEVAAGDNPANKISRLMKQMELKWKIEAAKKIKEMWQWDYRYDCFFFAEDVEDYIDDLQKELEENKL